MGQEDSFPDSWTKENMVVFQKKLPVSLEEYHNQHRLSIEHRDDFWRLEGERLKWDKKFTSVVIEDFSNTSISWFSDGTLNPCRNVLDIPIENGKGSERALVYFRYDGNIQSYNYLQLQKGSCPQ